MLFVSSIALVSHCAKTSPTPARTRSSDETTNTAPRVGNFLDTLIVELSVREAALVLLGKCLVPLPGVLSCHRNDLVGSGEASPRSRSGIGRAPPVASHKGAPTPP